VLRRHRLQTVLKRLRGERDVDVVVTYPSVLVHDERTDAEGETMQRPAEDVSAYEELGMVTRAEIPPPGR
jgi:hypothetical protein